MITIQTKTQIYLLIKIFTRWTPTTLGNIRCSRYALKVPDSSLQNCNVIHTTGTRLSDVT